MELSDKQSTPKKPPMSLLNIREMYKERMSSDYKEEFIWRLGGDRPHPWKDFRLSNPLSHNPDDYCYLVHAIRPYEYEDPNNAIEYFLKKPAISMSLVSNRLAKTFYRVGFILSVPSTNIVAARPHDSACAILNGDTSEREFQDAIKEANDIWGVFSPDELLLFSQVEISCNEVYAITGFKYSTLSKVNICGVFMDRSSDEVITNLANGLGAQLSVPLVTI